MIRIVRLDAKIALRSLSDMLGERPARTKVFILIAIVALLHAIAGYVVVHFAPDESDAGGRASGADRGARWRPCCCCRGALPRP